MQLSEAMEKRNITLSSMAERMKTSRSVLNKLLDKNDLALKLIILQKAAKASDKKVAISLK